MVIYSKQALLSALGGITDKPVAFLVGSPLSNDTSGNGVPGIAKMLEITREIVLEKRPGEVERYERDIAGKTGAIAYQAAMEWLQANVHQDAVNMAVRRAVLKACVNQPAVGDLNDPKCGDGEPSDWYIPAGSLSLAKLVCGPEPRYHGPILTPNFDPLLSLGVRAAGKMPVRRTLDVDGALPREIELDADARSIIHLHG